MATASSDLPIKDFPGGVAFPVHARPGASRSAVLGLHGGALKVAVAAAPEKGKANAALEALLAKFLGLPKRQVTVVGGRTSRQKRVRALGIQAAQLRKKLEAL